MGALTRNTTSTFVDLIAGSIGFVKNKETETILLI